MDWFTACLTLAHSLPTASPSHSSVHSVQWTSPTMWQVARFHPCLSLSLSLHLCLAPSPAPHQHIVGGQSSSSGTSPLHQLTPNLTLPLFNRKNQNQTRADLFGSSSSSSNSRSNGHNREQQTALLYEQQNDLRMEELASKVSALNKVPTPPPCRSRGFLF